MKALDIYGKEIKLGAKVKNTSDFIGTVEEIINKGSWIDCVSVYFPIVDYYKYYDLKTGIVIDYDEESLRISYDHIELI